MAVSDLKTRFNTYYPTEIQEQQNYLNQDAENRAILGASTASIAKTFFQAMGVGSSSALAAMTIQWLQGAITLSCFPYALALGFVAAFSFNTSSGIYNLDNLEILNKYRNRILDRYDLLKQEMTEGISHVEIKANRILWDAGRKFGWENFFKYGVVLPGDFEEILAFQTQFMQLDSLLAFYDEMISGYEAIKRAFPDHHFKYNIPPVKVYRDRLAGLSPDQDLFMKLDLDQALRVGFFSPQDVIVFKRLRQDYLDAKRAFDQATGIIVSNYDALIHPHMRTFQQKADEADRAYRKHIIHEKLERLNEHELNEKGHLAKRKQRDPELVEVKRAMDSFVELMHDLGYYTPEDQNLPLDYRRSWLQKIESCKIASEQIEGRYQAMSEEITRRYGADREILQRSLHAAEEIRNEKVRVAREVYERATYELEERKNALIEPQLNIFNRAKSSITVELCSFSFNPGFDPNDF